MAVLTITCEHDTGSATDCRPACDAMASSAITYWIDGIGVQATTHLCKRHTRLNIYRIGESRVDSIVAL